MSPARPILALSLAVALAGCGGAGERDAVASLDEELTASVSGNGDDPMLAIALEDPLMVDPQLAGRANADSVRPPSQPYSAPIPASDVAAAPIADEAGLMTAPAPTADCKQCTVARQSLTLGALAAGQPDRRTSGCVPGMRYAAGWANRLPADLPLHPAARVVEAAGNQAQGCALRAVTFNVSRPMATMLDWYFTQASKGGYASQHQADGGRHVLAGSRARDGAAYTAYMTERADGGTDIDLVANNGR